MRRISTLLGAVLLVGCQAGQDGGTPLSRADLLASIFDGRSGTLVDLTHAFSPGTIFWPTDTLGFRLEVHAG